MSEEKQALILSVQRMKAIVGKAKETSDKIKKEKETKGETQTE